MFPTNCLMNHSGGCSVKESGARDSVCRLPCSSLQRRCSSLWTMVHFCSMVSSMPPSPRACRMFSNRASISSSVGRGNENSSDGPVRERCEERLERCECRESIVPSDGVYRELRLSSPAFVYVDVGLDDVEAVSPVRALLALAGDVGETAVASVVAVNELSLRFRLVLARDLELSPSVNNEEESVVLTDDGAGEPGRVFGLGLASR